MTTVYTETDICVMCGAYVPEGSMVCPMCKADPFRMWDEKPEN